MVLLEIGAFLLTKFEIANADVCRLLKMSWQYQRLEPGSCGPTPPAVNMKTEAALAGTASSRRHCDCAHVIGIG